MRPAWAEVDLSAIEHNFCQIRRAVGTETEIMAVVKADGYGHGAVEVSRTVLKAGADRLGIAILEEGLELREKNIKVPILILGYTPSEQYREAIVRDIALTVYDVKQAHDLSLLAQKLNKPARIHIKVDTGMGRLGFLPGKSLAEVGEIMSLEGVIVEGVYTHLATADERDKSYALTQLEAYNHFIFRLQKFGTASFLRHVANSAALIEFPESRLDMVRPGITIYGLYPSPEVNRDLLRLKPAMSFKASISHVKQVPPGFAVSYGRTFITSKESIVATVPVGYADGYSRLFSNCGEVLVGGKRVPVIGRVCMDQIMIDVTSVPEVRTGDEAVLFGKQGKEYLAVDELARKMGTINYEVVCMLGGRVPRKYLK